MPSSLMRNAGRKPTEEIALQADRTVPNTRQRTAAAFSPLIAPRSLWPIDRLFISYFAITGFLIAFTVAHHPTAWLFLLGHVVVIGIILVLRQSSSRIA